MNTFKTFRGGASKQTINFNGESTEEVTVSEEKNPRNKEKKKGRELIYWHIIAEERKKEVNVT